ncbi:hypothetical protein BS50DRAFT_30470 [Corynespora cassiicola Philippines]|uniref:Beta/gamma crystallin 'Greek key' domain-containing protein n=1 Tax=Corynespora cassiicola Philippines TaxID=1448308 RepID=A0A2T2PBH2_CORCC|nr:hypothetical protein BS50DRAFT_30470 [Corynespora cassiicola Philippines]
MKTTVSTALIAFSLALSALAAPAPEPNKLAAREDSNVLIDNEASFPGHSGQFANLVVTIGDCQNLNATFNNQVSAISPNGILTCTLYDDFGCIGAASVPITGRVQDLADPRYNFDNRASSLRCNRR